MSLKEFGKLNTDQPLINYSVTSLLLNCSQGLLNCLGRRHLDLMTKLLLHENFESESFLMLSLFYFYFS